MMINTVKSLNDDELILHQEDENNSKLTQL